MSRPTARPATPGSVPRRFVPHHHAVWEPHVIEDIQLKAELGRYRIRGIVHDAAGPNFDDLTFMPCTLSRIPLEGYREQLRDATVLGTRFAEKPVELRHPDHGHAG